MPAKPKPAPAPGHILPAIVRVCSSCGVVFQQPWRRFPRRARGFAVVRTADVEAAVSLATTKADVDEDSDYRDDTEVSELRALAGRLEEAIR